VFVLKKIEKKDSRKTVQTQSKRKKIAEKQYKHRVREKR
jgi:hypothetical protein